MTNPLLELFGQLWPYLTSGAIVGGGVFLYLLKNPDKLEKWGSIAYNVAAYVSESNEKKFMATNIQSVIYEKNKEFGVDGALLDYGLNIKWTEDESVEIDLDEKNVVVMLQHFKSQSKNLANVVSLYIPNALLSKSRPYVDEELMSGIDFVFGKEFLKNNPPALSYYVDNESRSHSELVKEYMKQLEELKEGGTLSRIIVPELKTLNKLYPLESSARHYAESLELFSTIHTFETLDSSVKIDGFGIHKGENMSMAIVPVGKYEKLLYSGTDGHLGFIRRQIEDEINHFYIVGTERNIVFAKSLTLRTQRELGLNLIYEVTYKGKFRNRNVRKYCALCSV